MFLSLEPFTFSYPVIFGLRFLNYCNLPLGYWRNHCLVFLYVFFLCSFGFVSLVSPLFCFTLKCQAHDFH